MPKHDRTSPRHLAKPIADPRPRPSRPLVAKTAAPRRAWRRSSSARAEDEAAREYWSDRVKAQQKHDDGNKAVAAERTLAIERLKYMDQEGIAFVYGSDRQARPSSATQKTKDTGARAELIELTPRGIIYLQRPPALLPARLPTPVPGARPPARPPA
eukprot:SAG11_NODE_14019_length_628_cov_1.468809_1_plen_156_part_10